MKNKILYFLILLTSIYSCKKKETLLKLDPVYDSSLIVNTNAALNILCNAASIGGVIKSGITYSEKGIVLGTSSLPTTSDKKFIDANANNSIEITATGLLPQTKYYYRAYVIQNGSTNYGNEGYFTTPTCDGNNNNNGIVDTNFFCELEYDGNSYRVNYSGINFANFINPDFTAPQAGNLLAGLYSNILNDGLTQFVFADSSGLNAGFQIHLNEILNQGTYIINSSNYNSGDRDVVADKITFDISNALVYDLDMYNRVKNGSNCIETKLSTTGNLTWNITSKTQLTVPLLEMAFDTDKMSIYEGNFSGTFYENNQTINNCRPSRAVPFTCSFRMPSPSN
jgi:hypothetical protein